MRAHYDRMIEDARQIACAAEAFPVLLPAEFSPGIKARVLQHFALFVNFFRIIMLEAAQRYTRRVSARKSLQRRRHSAVIHCQRKRIANCAGANTENHGNVVSTTTISLPPAHAGEWSTTTVPSP